MRNPPTIDPATHRFAANHGLWNTRIFRIWNGMIGRCYDTKHNAYKRYGGRGIKVCDDWQRSVANLLRDMGQPPTAAMTLERMNNDGNYEPTNCKWATRKEQSNNKCNNHLITFNDQTLNITQWGEVLNISRDTLYDRITRRHWSIEKAFTQKCRDYPHRV